jgi:hypothetical protein
MSILHIHLSSLSNHFHAARMICCVVHLPPSPPLLAIDFSTFIIHVRCFRRLQFKLLPSQALSARLGIFHALDLVSERYAGEKCIFIPSSQHC